MGAGYTRDLLGHDTKNRFLMEHSKDTMYCPRKEFLAVDKTKHGLDNDFVGISHKDSFR